MNIKLPYISHLMLHRNLTNRILNKNKKHFFGIFAAHVSLVLMLQLRGLQFVSQSQVKYVLHRF